MTDKPMAMFHINFTNSHYYTVPVLGMNCLFNFEMFLREGETYTRKTKRYKQRHIQGKQKDTNKIFVQFFIMKTFEALTE